MARQWRDMDGAEWKVWTSRGELFFENREGLFAVKIRENLPVDELTEQELQELLERARG